MDSLDKFFFRIYNSKSYTCYHFAGEVWQYLTGIDLMNDIHQIINLHLISRGHIKRFKILDKPVSPCLVVMQRGITTPHIGVYVDGNILHIHGGGVEYQPIRTATRGFTQIRYVVCKN